MRRQCKLDDLPWPSLDYRGVGASRENLELMRRRDEPYTATPFYGIRRMTAWRRSQGYGVNPKRVSRRMLGYHGELCRDEIARARIQGGRTIARHTSPHRLSAVAGEKMNQFADFENRKSQITRWPDDPMSPRDGLRFPRRSAYDELRVWFQGQLLLARESREYGRSHQRRFAA